MNLDTLFQACNTLALVGWIALLAAPLTSTLTDRIVGALTHSS